MRDIDHEVSIIMALRRWDECENRRMISDEPWTAWHDPNGAYWGPNVFWRRKVMGVVYG